MAEEIKTPETEESGKNFIINFIDEDIAEGGQFQGMTVHTRFPPELVLSLEMLMGRLELMPLLALFLGSTWRD